VCAELSSDAKQLIFSALYPTGGRGRQLMGVPIWSPVISAWDWALSPDGTDIAFIDREGSRIRMVSLKSQAAQEIHVRVGNGLAGVSWAVTP
jgi:hypothetical protein